MQDTDLGYLQNFLNDVTEEIREVKKDCHSIEEQAKLREFVIKYLYYIVKIIEIKKDV